VWLFLRTFLIEAFRIPSGSMENTLLIGDFLFVNKLLYGAEVPLLHKRLPAVREPRRDDVVVFDSVEEEGLKVVKRLVGMPGDTLAMKSGDLWRKRCPRRGTLGPPRQPQRLRRFVPPRQDARLAGEVSRQRKPCDLQSDLQDWGPIVVPNGHYFMMGDNRDDSYDGATGDSCPARTSAAGR
jgi:signal peptidase I